MMSVNPLRDPFHYCWPVLLKESGGSSALFFEGKDFSISDSRDVDFSKTENRLAYMNKYGHVNVALVEKCVGDFLEKHFEGNKNYFPKFLKICSLSNGPGVDIVGFLRALNKTEQPNCNPVLQAINLNDSWENSFKNLISSAYRAYISKFIENCTILHENIQFLQCDIFSDLTPGAQNLIGTCDILLMVKVFFSTKATQKVFSETLQKIFSLLKPETLVFFFGNKKNIKDITTNKDIKKYVKCLFGPAKIDQEKLSVFEIISKQKLYGDVKFLVLQKVNVSEKQDANSQEILSKNEKKRTKRKNRQKRNAVTANSNNFTATETTVNDSEEESTTDSKSSCTSSSLQSDATSLQSQSQSHENKSQSIASQNVNNIDYVDEKKQSMKFPIQYMSPPENMYPFEKTNAGPADGMTGKDITSKENFNKGPALNMLQAFCRQFTFSEDVPNKYLNSYQKQSVQPEPFKIQSTNDTVLAQNVNSVNFDSGKKECMNFAAGSTSENTLPFEKINSTSYMPKPNVISYGRFTDRSILNQDQHTEKIIRIETEPKVMCGINSEEGQYVKNSTASNQSELTAQKQYQLSSNGTFPEQIVSVTNKDDLHSMIQRCETLVASLEKAVAAVAKDLQSQNGEKFIQGCSPGHSCSNFRNLQCYVHHCNFSGHSCCRKMYDGIRSCCSFRVGCSNCLNSMGQIKNACTYHSETNINPYLLIPVQNEDLTQILSLISK